MITKVVAAKMVPFEKVGNKRFFSDYEDLHDLLPRIFIPEKLEPFLKGGKETLSFGDSFRTDGIQLQLQVVNAANREAKARKKAATATTKRLKAEAVAAGEVYKRPKPPKKKPPSTILPKKAKAKPTIILKEGATLVALDTGIRNVAGVAREDDLDGAFTIPTGKYCHDTGIKRRQKEHANYFRDARKEQPDWADKHDEMTGVSVKTSDPVALLSALHIRGKHFREMYAFYGEERVARHRFQNYIGAQKTLHAMVKLVAPQKTDVVVVGDPILALPAKGFRQALLASLFAS